MVTNITMMRYARNVSKRSFEENILCCLRGRCGGGNDKIIMMTITTIKVIVTSTLIINNGSVVEHIVNSGSYNNIDDEEGRATTTTTVKEKEILMRNALLLKINFSHITFYLHKTDSDRATMYKLVLLTCCLGAATLRLMSS